MRNVKVIILVLYISISTDSFLSRLHSSVCSPAFKIRIKWNSVHREKYYRTLKLSSFIQIHFHVELDVFNWFTKHNKIWKCQLFSVKFLRDIIFKIFFLNILLFILNEHEGMHANTEISHGTEIIIFLPTVMHSSVKSSYFCSQKKRVKGWECMQISSHQMFCMLLRTTFR